MRYAPLSSVLVAALCPVATGQESLPLPLPLNTIADGRIPDDALHVDYRFDAREAGVLTVVVRAPADEGENDLFLAVAPVDSVMPRGHDDLMFMEWGGGFEAADFDHLNEATSEQLAATIHAPGAYVVRVGGYQPAPFRLAASFLPFPEVARDVPRSEPVRLEPGAWRLAEVTEGATHIYDLQIPADGMLTIVTRGSGDLSLTVLDRSAESGVVPLGMADNDQSGAGADESIVVDVAKGQNLQVIVSTMEPSRYVIVTHLTPRDAALAEVMAKAAAGPPNPLIGAPLPEFECTTLDGEAISLTEAPVRVLLLDFWATWCPPCVKALPDVQKLHDWATKNDLPVAVFAVNSGETPELVRSFVQRQRLSLPVLLDEEGTADEPLQITAIPTTVIVADGIIRHVYVGLQPNHRATLQSAIEAILAE